MSVTAFRNAVPGGQYIVSLGLVMFAFATMIAWYYYAEKAIEYIAGRNAVKIYRIIFAAAVFFGSTAAIQSVWEIADFFNGMMAVPNLLALIGLSAEILNLSKDFFEEKSRQ